MNVGILECDHVPERFRHIAGDYRDMFSALLSRYAPHLTLKYFDVCNGQLPSLDDCDAFLCTGSRYSAYEDVDWILQLKHFVRSIYEAQVPFVGICFGHQLLAEALGGDTVRSSKGWGVGVQTMEIVQLETWMVPEQQSCSLSFMHQDQVRRMPKGGVLLAKSAHCPIAMFRVGHNMLGLQAHPELSSAYCAALLSDRIERIGEANVRAAQLTLNQSTNEGLMIDWIANFLQSRDLPQSHKA